MLYAPAGLVGRRKRSGGTFRQTPGSGKSGSLIATRFSGGGPVFYAIYNHLLAGGQNRWRPCPLIRLAAEPPSPARVGKA
jgi:hypothetical protein